MKRSCFNLPSALSGSVAVRNPEAALIYLNLALKVDAAGNAQLSLPSLAKGAGMTSGKLSRILSALETEGLIRIDSLRGRARVSLTTDDTPSDTLSLLPEMAYPAPHKEVTDYAAFVEFFNTTVNGTGIPAIRIMTDARRKLVDQRIKDYGKDTVAKVVRMSAQNDFLSGRSGKWCASFDWIMKKSNFLKILEGTYDNRLNTQGNSAPGQRKASVAALVRESVGRLYGLADSDGYKSN